MSRYLGCRSENLNENLIFSPRKAENWVPGALGQKPDVTLTCRGSEGSKPQLSPRDVGDAADQVFAGNSLGQMEFQLLCNNNVIS